MQVVIVQDNAFILSSSSHTTKYYHSTLRRLSIIHIHFVFF